MTYCYVFNAEPDGVGIITDTRLSSITTFGEVDVDPEDYLKVYSPTKRAAIIISGNIRNLKNILQGVEAIFFEKKESKWFDSFIEKCTDNYLSCCDEGVFSSDILPQVQIIYADIRHRKGSTKCRMVRLEFYFENGEPKIARRYAMTGQYLSIGWSPEGRHELNESASYALCELDSRSLIIRKATKDEIKSIEKVNGKLKNNSVLSVMDSSGDKDGTFLKKLRKYCKKLPRFSQTTMHYDPVMVFSAAAVNSIEIRMDELRKKSLQYHETVGNTFVISTLTQKQGFKQYSDKELRAINGLFSMPRANKTH